MSRHKKRASSRMFGLLLILSGIGWILHEMGLGYYIRGSIGAWILFAFGMILMLNGFTQNIKRRIIWGTFLMLAGAFNLLQDFRYIHPYLIDIWPLYIGALGVGFMATTFTKPYDFTALIPGGIFLFSGAYIFMEVNELCQYDIMYNSNRILAVFLILIGSLLLWKNPKKKIKEEAEDLPVEESTNSGKSNI